MPSQPVPPHHLSLVTGVVHDIEATSRAFLRIHRHMNDRTPPHFVAEPVTCIDEPNVETRYLRAAARTGDSKRPAINFYARKHIVVDEGTRQLSVLPPSRHRLASSRSLPSRYSNQEEYAPAGGREIASPRAPIKRHDRQRMPNPNTLIRQKSHLFTLVQIERRHIGVEALFRVMNRKRKRLIGILLHPILARPEDP